MQKKVKITKVLKAYFLKIQFTLVTKVSVTAHLNLSSESTYGELLFRYEHFIVKESILRVRVIRQMSGFLYFII